MSEVTHFGTFGSGQVFEGFIVEIESPADDPKARHGLAHDAMMYAFSGKFSFVYPVAGMKEQVERWGYKTLCRLRVGRDHARDLEVRCVG